MCSSDLRWEVLRDVPRTNAVRLEITVMPEAVSADFPSAVGMESVPGSTVEATFTNEGGRVAFAGLSPMTNADFSGGSIDLAGTIEWSCRSPG